MAQIFQFKDWRKIRYAVAVVPFSRGRIPSARQIDQSQFRGVLQPFETLDSRVWRIQRPQPGQLEFSYRIARVPSQRPVDRRAQIRVRNGHRVRRGFLCRKNRRRQRGEGRVADQQGNGRDIAVAVQFRHAARKIDRDREQVVQVAQRRRPAQNLDRPRWVCRVAAQRQFDDARGRGVGDIAQVQRQLAEFGHHRKAEFVRGRGAGSDRERGRTTPGIHGNQILHRDWPFAFDRGVAERE